jgi:hypothetical protein
MLNKAVHERLAALERHADIAAERWREVHERIDTLRGVVLGVLLSLQQSDPRLCGPLIEALRLFEREAKRLKAYEVSVADTRELVEVIDAFARSARAGSEAAAAMSPPLFYPPPANDRQPCSDKDVDRTPGPPTA